MRLLRLKIENFRNFEMVECELGTHVVLLGENGAGKSNLLRALRLVLDPEMPDSDRQLEAEDFWAGAPPFAGTEIKVTVELTGYKTNRPCWRASETMRSSRLRDTKGPSPV